MSIAQSPYVLEHADRVALFICGEEIKTTEFSGGRSLAVDYQNQLLKVGFNKSFFLIYRFHEIDWVVLRVNDESVINTSTSSALGRAALIGTLTGGLGALVGAMTAKKTQKHVYKSIVLVLKLPQPDLEFTYNLYQAGFFKGYSTEMALEVGRRICERLIECKNASLRPSISNQADGITSTNEITPNLASLADLFARGLLTQEEFTAAKRKLLA